MKKFLFGLLTLVLVAGMGVGLIVAYQAMKAERAAEGDEDKPIVAESRVQRSTSGEIVVVLDAETRQRIQLAATALAPFRLTREVCAFGTVLDVSALAALHTEWQTADIAVEFSRREWARLKKLHEEGQNVSLRSVETAEAEFLKNKALRQGIEERLALSWGKVIGEPVKLGAFLRSLLDSQGALVRLDLLPGETVQAPPPTAAIALLADETQVVEGTYLDLPAPVDSTAPVQSFVYQVKGTRWPPGTRLIARMKREGEILSGVLIPESAIVRDRGQAWAYQPQGENTFLRRRVVLEQPVAGGWLVTRDWKPGERVVTTGAQTLLSEELKSYIKLAE